MTIASPCSCVICKKETSNLGLAAHIRLAHEGDTAMIRAGNNARRGQKAWNNGMTLTDEHKEKISSSLKGRKISRQSIDKMISTGKRKGTMGGFRVGGGRGKKGRYRGIWCDSSWELAFLIWAIDNGKSISRINQPRSYTFNGRVRKYYPDFLVDGEIVEIKGWKTEQWEAKLQENPDVKVMSHEQIKPILDYVVMMYGGDFTRLYEQ